MTQTRTNRKPRTSVLKSIQQNWSESERSRRAVAAQLMRKRLCALLGMPDAFAAE